MPHKCFIFLSSFLIAALFTLDLATWIMGVNVYVQARGECFSAMCVEKWLIACGLISIYINFFRLWDLGHLYSVMGEETTRIQRTHFICRIGLEVAIVAFHVISAVIGVFIVRYLENAIGAVKAQANGYDIDRMIMFAIAVICGHVCYIFISLYIARLKCRYLRYE